MKLTIVAATGGIGRQVLEQAIAAGHEVTAAVRNPKNLRPNVSAVAVNLAAADPAALESAFNGADAVLSGLGRRTPADAEVAWRGTKAIVQAMRATGVQRVVAVSAAPVSTVPSPGQPNPPKHDPGDGFLVRNFMTPIIKAALRQAYSDLALMEDVLRDSGLHWTIVRPPRLTDSNCSGGSG